MDLILFYAFAAIAVGSSLVVVGQRQPMHSVMMLIVSFGALAGLYVLLDSPFVAVTQIIIYAGAIMVLFLFVVMLLNASTEEGPRPGTAAIRRYGALLSIALAAELVWALAVASRSVGAADAAAVPMTSVRDLGILLFTDYAFAFEATSVLILVAMVGAVVLARKES